MALSNDFNMALDYERLRDSGDFSERLTKKQRVDDLRLRMRGFFTSRV